MLRRRPKRRYISIICADATTDAFNSIMRRHTELFGFVLTERAAIRLMQSEDKMMIIRCRLEQLDDVLVAITFSELSAITLGISGSINRLRKSVQQNNLTSLDLKC
jgi:RNase P/RNase MRP subunit POP5